MLNKFLPPIPSNPLEPANGIYKVTYSPDLRSTINKLEPKLCSILRNHIHALETVITLYKDSKAETNLSTILKALNVPDADIAKIPNNIGSEEIVEYWELTTDDKKILKMGASTHFSSCYRGGYQPQQILDTAKFSGLALVQRLDSKGSIRERFLITADKTVGEAQFGVNGRLKASNWKSPTYDTSRAKLIFEAFCNSKVQKLEGEELKNFKWE